MGTQIGLGGMGLDGVGRGQGWCGMWLGRVGRDGIGQNGLLRAAYLGGLYLKAWRFPTCARTAISFRSNSSDRQPAASRDSNCRSTAHCSRSPAHCFRSASSFTQSLEASTPLAAASAPCATSACASSSWRRSSSISRSAFAALSSAATILAEALAEAASCNLRSAAYAPRLPCSAPLLCTACSGAKPLDGGASSSSHKSTTVLLLPAAVPVGTRFTPIGTCFNTMSSELKSRV